MQRRPKETVRQESYEKFLLAEYDHISQAHFNTVSSISSFFQYYLVMISMPISAAVALGKLDYLADEKKRSVFFGLLDKHCVDLGMVGTAIFAALLCVVGYMMNLRADALLYARTVNGIRRYFTGKAGISLREEFRTRVLPRSTHFPAYLEPHYFGYVVLAFAVFNSLVLSGGWWRCLSQDRLSVHLVFAVGVLIHVLAYLMTTGYREYGYLHGHVLGVDIDGVLGRHREQFCRLLGQLRHKQVSPEDIARIPVHECPGLGVTESDEIAVFNNPGYWVDMPAYPEAAYVLKRMQDILHYKVHVFSWREWPLLANRTGADQRRAMEKKWRNAASPGRGSIMRAALLAAVTAWQAMRGHGSGKRKRTRDSKLPLGLRMNRFLHSLRFWDYRRPICRITRDWLWRKGINFDYLTIERGNVDSPDRIGNVRNRFVICQARKIRMFVEDDLQKARRLADICDVVFLVKHPYNRYIPGDERLPSNVVEVDGWPEIYSFVRHDL